MRSISKYLLFLKIIRIFIKSIKTVQNSRMNDPIIYLGMIDPWIWSLILPRHYGSDGDGENLSKVLNIQRQEYNYFNFNK